ncbi:MAG: hypothetical protein BWZ10_00281 [candidate division BRC1 bacterium ADurb.BinA364]|nr:MAG: hypothetical protein BWZ10_00281 [candidate division BRC1 bacterium ADurb.BinA364]
MRIQALEKSGHGNRSAAMALENGSFRRSPASFLRKALSHIMIGWLATAILAAAFAAEGADAPALAASPPPRGRALVGAIRWDVWVGDLGLAEGFKHGIWNEMALASDEQWRDRIPFYGEWRADGSVRARFTDQETMDREIAYAKGALDYWAFLDYPPWSQGDGRMHTALRLYLSSAHKADLNFCIILNHREWWLHRETYLGYFREPTYQTTVDGRPLVYLLMLQISTEENARAQAWLAKEMASLSEQSEAQGTGKPYYVVMCFRPTIAAMLCDLLGADAVSAYAKPKKGAGEPYAEYAQYVEQSWNGYKDTGKQVVPICMTGWDQRPRTVECDNPQWARIRESGPGWFRKATPEEIARHIAAAARWNRENPDAARTNAVIVYNWNEFTEGGWLCPVLGEEDARLRAIEKARLAGAW